MCIRYDHEIESLEIESRLLELYRLYESIIRAGLSESDWNEMNMQMMINEFSSYAKARLPALLEKEERGDMYA